MNNDNKLILESIMTLKHDIRTLNENIKHIETLLSGISTPEGVSKGAYVIIRDAKRVLKAANNISMYIPEPSPQYISTVEDAFTIDFKNGAYRFVLNDLLPHRIFSPDGRTVMRYYDRNLLFSEFTNTLKHHTDELTHRFNERVTVFFLNIYGDKRNIRDVDNIDEKVFIDCLISSVVVPDDSPEWVRRTTSAIFIPNSVDHTEVFVGRDVDVKKYISEVWSDIV